MYIETLFVLSNTLFGRISYRYKVANALLTRTFGVVIFVQQWELATFAQKRAQQNVSLAATCCVPGTARILMGE
jgi:hypothetical protein